MNRWSLIKMGGILLVSIIALIAITVSTNAKNADFYVSPILDNVGDCKGSKNSTPIPCVTPQNQSTSEPYPAPVNELPAPSDPYPAPGQINEGDINHPDYLEPWWNVIWMRLTGR